MWFSTITNNEGREAGRAYTEQRFFFFFTEQLSNLSFIILPIDYKTCDCWVKPQLYLKQC